MEFFTQFWEAFQGIVATSGFYDVIVNFLSTGWQNLIMLGVACFLLYLAIKKQFEPLLLLPIAFGMLLANLPIADSGLHYHDLSEFGLSLIHI